jgi:hypothetical protein
VPAGRAGRGPRDDAIDRLEAQRLCAAGVRAPHAAVHIRASWLRMALVFIGTGIPRSLKIAVSAACCDAVNCVYSHPSVLNDLSE